MKHLRHHVLIIFDALLCVYNIKFKILARVNMYPFKTQLILTISSWYLKRRIPLINILSVSTNEVILKNNNLDTYQQKWNQERTILIQLVFYNLLL